MGVAAAGAGAAAASLPPVVGGAPVAVGLSGAVQAGDDPENEAPAADCQPGPVSAPEDDALVGVAPVVDGPVPVAGQAADFPQREHPVSEALAHPCWENCQLLRLSFPHTDQPSSLVENCHF